jgi:hypothetical protein
MKTPVRILIQLIVAGPVLIYVPFAIIAGIGSIASLLIGEPLGPSKSLAYGLGWLGLLGLYGSIFTPTRTVQRHHWLRLTLTVALACGFIATAAVLANDGDPAGFMARAGVFGLYLLAGPVVVGCWNLALMHKRA